MSIGFYIIPRWFGGRLDKLDIARVLIPPLAFVGWTMLQRTTAFDAAFPSMMSTQRTVVALFLGGRACGGRDDACLQRGPEAQVSSPAFFS